MVASNCGHASVPRARMIWCNILIWLSHHIIVQAQILSYCVMRLWELPFCSSQTSAQRSCKQMLSSSKEDDPIPPLTWQCRDGTNSVAWKTRGSSAWDPYGERTHMCSIKVHTKGMRACVQDAQSIILVTTWHAAPCAVLPLLLARTNCRRSIISPQLLGPWATIIAIFKVSR